MIYYFSPRSQFDVGNMDLFIGSVAKMIQGPGCSGALTRGLLSWPSRGKENLSIMFLRARLERLNITMAS